MHKPSRALAVALLTLLVACRAFAAEPVKLTIGYQPYDTISYSAVVIRALELWKKYLPPGSEVEFQAALQGSIIVNQMLANKQQIGYLGDMPAVVATTKRSVHFAEILLWHAIPLIGRLAAEEQSLGELREYSTQLLGDLENVYNGDVSAGHKGEKLQRRLQHNVEYARNMFGQRAQDEGLDGVELFDVQLARMITAKQGVQFGKDLAAAARAANSGDQKAEAS